MPRRSTTTIGPPDPEPAPGYTSQVRALLAEAQALSARLAALNEIAATMQRQLDGDVMLQTLARQARWVIDFQVCSIALRSDQGYHVRLLRGDGALPGPGPLEALGAGAIGVALSSGHAILLKDAAPADRAPPEMRSGLIVPLASAGELIGTLNFFARESGCYSQDDLRIASALATQVAALLQNVRLFGAVAQARDELRTVLESIGDAALVIDRAGQVRVANDAAARVLHADPATLIGRPALALFEPVEADGRPLAAPEALQPLIDLWREAAPRGSGTLPLSDGRHLEWSVAPLVATGVLDGVVLTFRDVSDRVALEQLRDDMIHMLVHDLRSPLTGMIMGLDMIQYADQLGDHDLRTEMLRAARSSSSGLLDQINMILDVRKLEAGRLEVARTPTSVVQLIERAAAAILPIAQHQQQELRVAPIEWLLIVDLDGALIQRVVENLLGNAVKFSPEGSTILVSAALAGADTIELAVEDQGPGIPAELRGAIFEKYSQAEGAARHKGTGLGLAFCKLAVEAHGGTIGVDRAAQGGSRFWVRLPVGPA